MHCYARIQHIPTFSIQTSDGLGAFSFDKQMAQ